MRFNIGHWAQVHTSMYEREPKTPRQIVKSSGAAKLN